MTRHRWIQVDAETKFCAHCAAKRVAGVRYQPSIACANDASLEARLQIAS